VFDRGVRARCLAVISALPMPRPFDMERFRLLLGCDRGRALRLIATPGVSGGLWIATADEDHVFYPKDVPPLGQLHAIAREIGHMVLGHAGAPAATSEIARLLLPSMDPELVVRTLVRTGYAGYAAADEEEADLFALLLLDHIEVEAGPLEAAR
jgi:hypothetical protein